MSEKKFGTEVMKDEEVLVFIEACVENGSDIAKAYKDMKFIDTCLHMKKLNFALGKQVRYTKAGYIRKDSGLLSVYSDLLQARIDDKF